MKIISLGLCAAVAAMVGCAAVADVDAASDEALTRRADQAEMNDLSILYPLAKSQAEMAGLVSASDPGIGGPLLPAELYTKATGVPLTRPSGPLPPGADAQLYYDELRVVGLRIDPCFANIGPITDADSCKNQLRLVLQPVRFKSGAASVVDGAVHAFYSLTRSELTDLVKDIIALRRHESGESSLGALAVHPLLVSQGLLGGEATGLRRIILAHAGASKLIRFTKFSPGNLATRWDFGGFDIQGSHSEPMVIPTLPDNATGVFFFSGFSSDLAGGFNPETTSTDNMQLLGNLAKAKDATKAAQQAAFDAALRIENPNKHSPDTIDCASCHVSGPGIALTGAKLGLTAKGNPNVFTPDPNFVSAEDMKQTTPVAAETSRNFRMFSYRDGHPMIAQRVINETAAVLAIVNGTLLR
jgi:hypothetical protein